MRRKCVVTIDVKDREEAYFIDEENDIYRRQILRGENLTEQQIGRRSR